MSDKYDEMAGRLAGLWYWKPEVHVAEVVVALRRVAEERAREVYEECEHVCRRYFSLLPDPQAVAPHDAPYVMGRAHAAKHLADTIRARAKVKP